MQLLFKTDQCALLQTASSLQCIEVASPLGEVSSMGDMKESRFTSRLSEKSLILSDIPIGFLANADVTGRVPLLITDHIQPYA